jgi:ribosomal protein L44E
MRMTLLIMVGLKKKAPSIRGAWVVRKFGRTDTGTEEMTTLTIQDWTNYLNRKTLGFNCPICGHNHWQTQPDNEGNVLDVKLLDHSFENELNSVDLVDIYESTKSGSEYTPPQKEECVRCPSLLQRCNVIRCGHCGWVGLFDREFVEEHLHDDE